MKFINSISPISNETTLKIKPLFAKKIYPKNFMLVSDGQIAREVFFLESGVIRTFYRKENGSEYNKAFDVQPALTCGYASLITGKPSKINLQTLTSCEIWTCQYLSFSKLYDEHPDLERAARITAEMAFVEKENRELEIALLIATDRYLLFKKQFPNLEQLIPQYHIASYLGISATQLSRIRRSLVRI